MIDSDTRSQAPGWTGVSLGEVRTGKGASWDPAKHAHDLIELYSVPAYPSGMPEVVAGADIGSSKQTVVPGTVLVCKINPRINRVWVVGEHTEHPRIASTEWIPFHPVNGVNPYYLKWALSTSAFRDYLAGNVSGVGGSLMRVAPSTVDRFVIGLSPIAEQHRIVAAIEQQFTRLDAAVVSLKRAQANLKRYRASVLKVACEGRLVPAEAELARAGGRDYEPASMLLERILAERRERWEEAQQAKRRAKGQPALPGMSLGKYKEPLVLETAELAELPEGWAWGSLGQLLIRSEYGTSVKCSYEADGFPVLRIPNVVAGAIDLRDMKFATQPLRLQEGDYLEEGDLLVCRTNGSIGLVGRSAVVPDGLPAGFSFASYLLRLRFTEAATVPSWAHLYLSSQLGRRFIEGHAASSAGQHNVSLSLLHSMPVPLPPLAEQHRIVAEVDRRLSGIGAAEAAVHANLKRAERLRQAILKRAFEGRLVPQDPDDEPASVLLEHIKAERESREAANPKRVPVTRGRARRQSTEPAAVSEVGARPSEVERVLP